MSQTTSPGPASGIDSAESFNHIAGADVKGWSEKAFVYDEPQKYMYRLFQLELPLDTDSDGDDLPLAGKLLSLTFIHDIHEVVHTVRATWKEDHQEVMERLSGTDEYVAVSYSWGTSVHRWPLFLKTVSCHLDQDDRVVTNHEPERHGCIWITSNAHSLLLEMRRQREKRFMWIDAICIDQASAQDKDYQIPRMKEVYEGADVVYVWLGESTRNEEMALQMMPNVTEKLKKCQISGQESLEIAFARAGLPDPDHDIWKAYASVLTRDWWSRLWTFQEVAMARETDRAVEYDGFYQAPNVTVWCGRVKIPWKLYDHFAEALTSCNLRAWLITGREDLSLENLHGLDAIAEVRTGRESSLQYGWAYSLSALLVATRRRDTSNPADMVWGMYALIDHAARKKLSLERNMSASDVFIRFAAHYIRTEVKECLLNHTSTLERMPGLPSWCPNFASHEECRSIGSRWFGHYQEKAWLKAQMPCAGFQKEGRWSIPRRKAYYARYVANSIKMKHSLHGLYDTKDPRQMALVAGTNAILASGICLDTVDEVIPCNPGAESALYLSHDNIQQNSAWDKACFSLAQRSLATSSSTSTSSARYDLYARTLTANLVVPNFIDVRPLETTWTEAFKGDLTDEEPNEQIVIDRHGKVDFAAPYLSLRNFMQMTLSLGESLPAKENLDPAARRFAQCLQLMSRRRRFFSTKAGRIGLGPSQAEPGDRVVVFFYCPTPYLIRPVEGRPGEWRFVGEAYVHGFMYGEALRLFDEEKVQESAWKIV